MRLTFCGACGATSDLHHHHIVPRTNGDDEANLIPLRVQRRLEA
jgi:diadenosine tetraphosphate (Ap4A) HIT family hydrolase